MIIPTYNEEKDIGEAIKSLLAQDYPKFEVIVVDDGSIDKTQDIVKKFIRFDKRVRLFQGQHKGPGFSRNLGARLAKGDILVFVDADMTFEKDYLEKITHPIIKNGSIGAEEEFQKANNLDSVWSRCWGSYTKDNRWGNSSKGYVFRSIRKDKFLQLGGFDPTLGYADDLTFYFKHKIRPDIAKNAFCYHKNPSTLREVYKQSLWIGSSLGNLNNKWINFPIFNIILISILYLLYPLMIIPLSVRKSYKISNFKIILPMIIFMTVRYFGTLNGILKKIFLKKNTR